MKSFKKYYLNTIENHYADFNGIATAKEFWLFLYYQILTTAGIVAYFVSIFYLLQLNNQFKGEGGLLFIPLALILIIISSYAILGYLALTLIPSVSIFFRRLRYTKARESAKLNNQNLEENKSYSYREYYLKVLKNQFFKFTGKTNKREFLLFFIHHTLTFMVLILILAIIFSFSGFAGILTLIVGALFLPIFMIFCLFPLLPITSRRLQDAGVSGWLLLLLMVPVGFIAILVLVLRPSEIINNKLHQKENNNIVTEEEINALEKLYNLKEKGIISEEEYNIGKKNLFREE